MCSAYLDLTLHGDAEKHNKVHNKDGPEHWHIEGFEERANHSDDDAFCCRMPESTRKNSTNDSSVFSTSEQNILKSFFF